MIVVSEIRPFLYSEEAISEVELYNDFWNDIYMSRPCFQELKVNAMTGKITNWSFLYWDKFSLRMVNVFTFCPFAFIQLKANTRNICHDQKQQKILLVGLKLASLIATIPILGPVLIIKITGKINQHTIMCMSNANTS